MAKLVFTNAFLTVNGVDLSDHVRSVEVSMSVEDVESTTMGATAVQREPGLGDDEITVTWAADFAAGKVDATLAPLVTGRTKHTIEVRPTNGARSATNPAYVGSGFITEYTPVAGSVGDLLEVDTTWAIDGGLSRLVA